MSVTKTDTPRLRIGSVVEFCGSPYTIVKINGNKFDIKQNFSIRLIYKDVNISDIKLLKQ